MAFEAERKIAVDAVAKACGLCVRVQQSLISAETLAKKDKSPVTVADYGVQAVVTAELLAAFPDIPMVGEEDASALRSEENAEVRAKVVEHVQAVRPQLNAAHILDAIDYGTYAGGASGRFWALDPIDGTKGFLRGDQYAIALGLIEDGEVKLGVLGCPNLPVDASKPEGDRGRVFVAVRGGGAFVRGVDDAKELPIKVSEVTDPAKATFCESVESAHTAQSDSARIAELLGVTSPPFRIDSQCKYAAIARGDSDIYLRMPTRADYEERIWDHAAGWMVVTEAGGCVTDIHGKPLDFGKGQTLKNNKGVVATNGEFHDKVIAAIREVLG